MKFGIVTGVCTPNRYTTRALQHARINSRDDTDHVVILNGISPSDVRIPTRTESLVYEHRIGQEDGVWMLAFDMAIRRHWDWCALIHDDFMICEQGWETQIEAAVDRYKIGMAAWCGRGMCDIDAMPGVETKGHSPIAVACDGAGLVFNMALFRERGVFSDTFIHFGYGDIEASCWVASREHTIFQIEQVSNHAGCEGNTRDILGIGADGLAETARRWRAAGVLPMYVEEGFRSVNVGGRSIVIAK